MRAGLTAGTQAAGADPDSSQASPPSRRGRWIALGIAAYLVTLVATLPARFVMSPGDRWAVAGTVWNGEAVIDGAYRVQWRWAPWRSLATLTFAADVRLTGTGTDLAGTAAMGPNSLTIADLAGTGDGGLLAAFGPRLPFVCDSAMALRLDRLVIAGDKSMARGTIRSEAGGCTAIGGGEAQPVPALSTRIEPSPDGTTQIAVSPVTRQALHFFEGGIAGGRLRLAPTAAGMAALPFARALVIDEAM